MTDRSHLAEMVFEDAEEEVVDAWDIVETFRDREKMKPQKVITTNRVNRPQQRRRRSKRKRCSEVCVWRFRTTPTKSRSLGAVAG